MGFIILFLLFLFAFDTSSTWATNAQPSLFKEVVCSQCQQSCENKDLVTVARVGKAGPPGDRGPIGPQGVTNMTLIELNIDRKIKEALQLFTGRSCDGAKLESALSRNHSGGVFKSYISGVGFKDVFCDLTDEGGNWTVFQRRINGNVDFYRGWDYYVKGFGDLQGDYWLGLEPLHQMTKEENIEMKIKIITKDGIHWVAKYSNFRIGPGSDNYRLMVSGYSGNATKDAFSYHNNYEFTSKGADHDTRSSGSCATRHEGGGWYWSCGTTNLNGNFHKTGFKGFYWWNGKSDVLLRFSEMKFRRRS